LCRLAKRSANDTQLFQFGAVGWTSERHVPLIASVLAKLPGNLWQTEHMPNDRPAL